VDQFLRSHSSVSQQVPQGCQLRSGASVSLRHCRLVRVHRQSNPRSVLRHDQFSRTHAEFISTIPQATVATPVASILDWVSGPLVYFGYWNWEPPFWHSSMQSAAAMLIYMQDGSAFEVTDYWVDANTLNYVTVDGTKGSITVATLDLQRTVDANARVGLRFTLDRSQGGRPFERGAQQPDPANPSQPQVDPGSRQMEVQQN
jgi:hypothetical protein